MKETNRKSKIKSTIVDSRLINTNETPEHKKIIIIESDWNANFNAMAFRRDSPPTVIRISYESSMGIQEIIRFLKYLMSALGVLFAHNNIFNYVAKNLKHFL